VASFASRFMSAQQDSSFARLVSLACHDLRTPLATVNGFARTIQRTESLEDPLGRYLEMIVAASAQMTDLLEGVSLLARIEGERYDPVLSPTDTHELASAAAEGLDGVSVEGAGEPLETDAAGVTRALVAFALCAQRHGPAPAVTLSVQGRSVVVSPVTDAAAPVIMGEALKDLGAAVAVRTVRALGGTVELADGELHVMI
jgi:signal transduction histidine kinase